MRHLPACPVDAGRCRHYRQVENLPRLILVLIFCMLSARCHPSKTETFRAAFPLSGCLKTPPPILELRIDELRIKPRKKALIAFIPSRNLPSKRSGGLLRRKQLNPENQKAGKPESQRTDFHVSRFTFHISRIMQSEIAIRNRYY